VNEQSQLIEDATRRIFSERGSPQAQRSPEACDRLWNALASSAITRTWIPDHLNGADASLADGFNVLRIAGEFAVSAPLAETMLAGWLLQHSEISTPDTRITVAPVDLRDRIAVNADGTLTGTARAVPFARECSQLVVLPRAAERMHVAVVDRDRCGIEQHTNVAGDGRDKLIFRSVVPNTLSTSPLACDSLMLMGAVARSMQMAGALQAILDLSVSYANERIAFEKPIGKFQAIQHALARLAGEAAAAIAAAGSAADALDAAQAFDSAVLLEAASAKVRVGEAATAGAAIAHQVHGAIGMSQDHVLHRYTQRLWAWRDDFGSESYWAARLGALVAEQGADALWPMLASR
jgi:acyl-CoA dehydrogenase